jgi:hypothetical protein
MHTWAGACARPPPRAAATAGRGRGPCPPAAAGAAPAAPGSAPRCRCNHPRRAPCHTATTKLRIGTLGISGGRSLTGPFRDARRFPSDMMVPRTGGYAYDVGVWDLSIVQGPFSVAPCQTLELRFATLCHRCIPRVDQRMVARRERPRTARAEHPLGNAYLCCWAGEASCMGPRRGATPTVVATARGLPWVAVSPSALPVSVTQRALSVTQRALSVTQRALSVTQ